MKPSMGGLARLARALGVVCTLGMLPACEWCFDVGVVSVWVKQSKATVTLPEGTTAHVEFKDASGQPTGTRSLLEGPGTFEIPVPADANTYDATTGPKGWDGPSPPFPRIVPPRMPPVPGGTLEASLAPGFGSAALPHDPPEYAVSCLSVDATPGEPVLAYNIRTWAASAVYARAKVDPILQGGPGTKLPVSTWVDAFVEIDVEADHLVISSSLPGRFERFVAEVDGEVVADLEADLNVVVIDEPGQWQTVRAAVPLSLASPGVLAVLRQAGQGQAEPATLQVQL